MRKFLKFGKTDSNIFLRVHTMFQNVLKDSVPIKQTRRFLSSQFFMMSVPVLSVMKHLTVQNF